MSILIKGMDIPKDERIIVVYPDGYTQLLMRSDMAEVPTPHGRLIDADALIELYEPAPAGVNEWEWERYKTTVGVIRQNIKDAPTVIEAEVE